MGAPTDGHFIYEGWQTKFTPYSFRRLDQIKAAGFFAVLNYAILHGHMGTSSDSGTNSIFSYLNYAQSIGLKVIVALNDPAIWLATTTIQASYPELYADSGNHSDTQGFIQYVVGQVMNHTAVWGYYIGDERLTANHAQLLTYYGYITAIDNTHPILYIADSFASDNFGGGGSVFNDVSSVIGDDYYLIGHTPLSTYRSLTSEALGIQSYATTNSKQSAVVLQAYSLATVWPATFWTGSVLNAPWVDARYMRLQRDIFQSNMTPRIIGWYAYEIIDSYGDHPRAWWNDLQWAVFGTGSLTQQSLLEQDTFYRGNQSGLGSSSTTGSTWIQVSGTLTTSLSSGNAVVTGATDQNIFLLGTLQKLATSPSLIMNIRLANANDTWGLVWGYVDSNNYTYVKVAQTSMQCVRVTSGTPTTLATVSYSALAVTDFFFLQMDVTSSGYNLTLWDSLYGIASSAATWTLSATDTPVSSGRCGVFFQLGSSGNSMNFYRFSVYGTRQANTITDGRH